MTFYAADAQCVDFSGVDLRSWVPDDYARLLGWDFRGALLAYSQIKLINVVGADLEGIHASDLYIMNGTLTGTIDQFSEIPAVCIKDGRWIRCLNQ